MLASSSGEGTYAKARRAAAPAIAKAIGLLVAAAAMLELIWVGSEVVAGGAVDSPGAFVTVVPGTETKVVPEGAVTVEETGMGMVEYTVPPVIVAVSSDGMVTTSVRDTPVERVTGILTVAKVVGATFVEVTVYVLVTRTVSVLVLAKIRLVYSIT